MSFFSVPPTHRSSLVSPGAVQGHGLPAGCTCSDGVCPRGLALHLCRTWPRQLGAARATLHEVHLHMNESLELSEKDVAQISQFASLRVVVLFGASDSRATQRNIQMLGKAMPWLQLDF